MSKCLKTIFAPCLLVVAICIFSVLGYSQSSTATLSGTIIDPDGRAIPGVSVTIENKATGFERQVTTNESGYFTVPLLPPGEYIVMAKANGFATVQVPAVILNVGDQKSMKVDMKVGDQSATVEVRPDENLVRTDANVGTLIDRRTVENIPLNGRSFQTLFELTPGVVLVPSGGSTAPGQFSVNGQRTNANYLTVDGVGANTGIRSFTSPTAGSPGQTGAGTAIGYTTQGSTAGLVSVDALQEFRIQTSSFAAEFGRMPGGQVSLVTRGGANDFHGTLFESFRDDALDANDWFANRNGLTPPLRQHQFGGTFNGPIIFPRFGEGGDSLWRGKDKAFFFFSYEGLRLLQPQSAVANVPSEERRNAAHPDIKPFINALPKPNGPVSPNGFAEFRSSWSDRNEYDAIALRIDYNVTQKHTIFGRFSNTPSFSENRFGLSEVTTTSQNNRSFTAGSTWIPTESIANDFRINFTETDGPARTASDTFGGASLLPETMFGSGRSLDSTLFSINFAAPGVVSGTSAGAGTTFRQRQFNIVDGITFSLGNHSVKVGGDFRRINPVFRGERGVALESIRFNLADIALSRAALYSTSISADEPLAVVYDALSLYAQDTWKATSRLTLTYGLRWEFIPPPHSTEGGNPITLANINDPYGGNVHINPPDTPLWKTKYDNFAPRVGVSYLLSSKQGQELVIRGGFGVFHDLGYGNSANAFFQFPYTASKNCTTAAAPECGGSPGPLPFPLTAAALAPPAFGSRPSSINNIFDPEIELPFTYQWNAAIERTFGAHQTLSISYVAAEGRRLLKWENYRINLTDFPPTATGATSVAVTRNNGHSDYRALQVQFQRRMHRNVQSLISYTFGRSRDTASSDNVVTIPGERLDIDSDYGYSSFDVRHVFTGAVSFDIPRLSGSGFINSLINDWGLDTMFRARSALPLNPSVNVSFNDPSFPFPEQFAVRPNLIPGLPVWIDDATVAGGRRLNNSPVYTPTDDAFLAAAGCLGVPRSGTPPPGVTYGPAVGAFCTPNSNGPGNLPRGLIRGFPAHQIDVSLRRDFPLHEKLKLRFWVEVFNILNTPLFADPNSISISTSTTFGVSQQTLAQGLGGLNALYQIGGPRSVQLSAKLVF